jgi:uncharacterized protein (TIGR03382 family)
MTQNTFSFPLAIPAFFGAMLIIASACGDQRGAQEFEGDVDAHADERALDGPSVVEGFFIEGPWAISHPLELETPGTRVAAMVVLKSEDKIRGLSFEARGNIGETESWRPLEEVWREDERQVLRVDLFQPVSTIQLRLPKGDLDKIIHLTFSASTPHPVDRARSLRLDMEEPTAVAQGLDGFLGAIGVVSRASWGARASNGCAGEAGKYRMAIHHTVTATSQNGQVEPIIRQAQAYHMDGRGYCDVAYHFLLSTDGRIFEGRPLNLRGGHTLNNNTGNIGMSYVGCFHPGCGDHQPTPEMLAAGGLLVATLSGVYGFGISADTVKGHRDHSGQSTACPGNFLHPQLQQIRDLALNGGADTECLNDANYGGCNGSVITHCNELNQVSSGDCAFFGASCSTAGGTPHCVHPFCNIELGSENGTYCSSDTKIATCDAGAWSEGDCAAYGGSCSEAGGSAHCVHYMCLANLNGAETGAFCLDDTRIGTCNLGEYGEGDCGAYGAKCSDAGGEGHCVHFNCWTQLNGGEDGTFCTPEGKLATCTLGAYAETDCASSDRVCGAVGDGAACVADSSNAPPPDPTPNPDADPDPDSTDEDPLPSDEPDNPNDEPPPVEEPVQNPDPTDGPHKEAERQGTHIVIQPQEAGGGCGGCSAGTEPVLGAWPLLMGALAWRRRRRLGRG